MFFGHKPSPETIKRFLDGQLEQPFSYPEVGATRATTPPGYNVDHNRIRLGEGREMFARAVGALKRWNMFEMDWVEIFPKNEPVVVGSTVAILVSHLGFWSLNASRIVYIFGEDAKSEQFGFAYGTLTEHSEKGEERFTVEYHPADKSVWYDLFAFSRPRHLLARAGYSFSRRLQKRFARDSLKAMEIAVKK